MSGLEQRLQDFSLENEKLKQENMTLRKKIELLNSEVGPPFYHSSKIIEIESCIKAKIKYSGYLFASYYKDVARAFIICTCRFLVAPAHEQSDLSSHYSVCVLACLWLVNDTTKITTINTRWHSICSQ